MADKTRMLEFKKTIEGIKWDIIGISEVRKESENFSRRRNGNYFKGYRGTAKETFPTLAQGARAAGDSQLY